MTEVYIYDARTGVSSFGPGVPTRASFMTHCMSLDLHDERWTPRLRKTEVYTYDDHTGVSFFLDSLEQRGLHL
jgi:hypothetical protein